MSILQGSNKRTRVSLLILIALAVLLVFLNIIMGSASVPLDEAVKGIIGKAKDPVYGSIIRSIRLPRTLCAFILGGALALSGYLLQTFFYNPIAGPFVLGISSGAKLVVALVMVLLIGRGIVVNSFVLILAAFVGAMLAMVFVLLVESRLKNPALLIVSGVMVGYICSAATDIVVTFADDSDIVNLHNWSKGSFSGISWENVAVMAVVTIIASMFVFMLSKEISAYRLGETYARSMGVNIRAFRIMLIVLSGILAATVTAFAGPVSFVGIAVPQLIKRIFRTSRPLIVIPACFFGGSVFCLFCDLIARCMFAPTELSISTVTAVFGAPIVIIVLLQKKKRVA